MLFRSHAIEVALGPTGTPGPLLTALAATSVTGPDAFGAGAVVGTSTQFARQDHDHGLPAAFDATAPTTSAVGDAAATGAAAVAARRDHTHGREAFATPVAVGQANTAGTATTLPHSDHVHQGVTSVTGGTGITVSGGDGSGHGAITLSASSSGALTQIAKTVVAVAGTVTFSSIPNTYENLVIVLMGASASAGGNDTLVVQFNGDTAGNYDYVQMNDNGTAVGQQTGVSQGSLWVGVLPAAARTTNFVGMARILIPSYARTVFHKCARSESWFMQTAGNQTLYEFGGIWHSTAAITSIAVKTGGAGGLDVGTVVTLYGES